MIFDLYLVIFDIYGIQLVSESVVAHAYGRELWIHLCWLSNQSLGVSSYVAM